MSKNKWWSVWIGAGGQSVPARIYSLRNSTNIMEGDGLYIGEWRMMMLEVDDIVLLEFSQFSK